MASQYPHCCEYRAGAQAEYIPLEVGIETVIASFADFANYSGWLIWQGNHCSFASLFAANSNPYGRNQGSALDSAHMPGRYQ